MITVHHCSNSRSLRILWLLEELGEAYDCRKRPFSEDSLKSPAYLAIHPLGSVPAVEVDGQILWESTAVMEYLLETRDTAGRLAPRPGQPGRGPFLQWLHFTEATAAGPIVQILSHTFLRPEDKRLPALAEEGRERTRTLFDVIERRLQETAYLAGDAFTAADIALGYDLHLASFVGLIGDDHPRLKAYFEALKARPAFERAAAL